MKDQIRHDLRERGFLQAPGGPGSQGIPQGIEPVLPTGVADDGDGLRERSFVAEVGNRTMLLSNIQPRITASANSHVLQLSGRFVGAEEANRNGALWTKGDLQMGLPTVPGGPLNWLHQELHIVGAITSAELVEPAVEQAAVTTPYIQADATMWSFLRPTEARVIRQAAEDGELFYSMECVSRAIECQDCKVEFSYRDVVKSADTVCDHLRERSSVRRLVDPVFLGGAVIVPPTRPGWADASLRVKAHEVAERTFDDAQPGVAAATWETLMAALIKLTSD